MLRCHHVQHLFNYKHYGSTHYRIREQREFYSWVTPAIRSYLIFLFPMAKPPDNKCWRCWTWAVFCEVTYLFLKSQRLISLACGRGEKNSYSSSSTIAALSFFWLLGQSHLALALMLPSAPHVANSSAYRDGGGSSVHQDWRCSASRFTNCWLQEWRQRMYSCGRICIRWVVKVGKLSWGFGHQDVESDKQRCTSRGVTHPGASTARQPELPDSPAAGTSQLQGNLNPSSSQLQAVCTTWSQISPLPRTGDRSSDSAVFVHITELIQKVLPALGCLSLSVKPNLARWAENIKAIFKSAL